VGADINVKNDAASTALMRAALKGHADACRVLASIVIRVRGVEWSGVEWSGVEWSARVHAAEEPDRPHRPGSEPDRPTSPRHKRAQTQ
jgi:ankyrin repeat protein